MRRHAVAIGLSVLLSCSAGDRTPEPAADPATATPTETSTATDTETATATDTAPATDTATATAPATDTAPATAPVIPIADAPRSNIRLEVVRLSGRAGALDLHAD